MKAEIGEVVRKLRKNRGLTLKELSDGILSYSALAAFERGKYVISFEKLLQLLNRLNFPLQEFTFLIEDEGTDFYRWLNNILYLFSEKNMINYLLN